MKKHIVFWVWIALIASAIYFSFFRNDLIRAGVSQLLNLPLSWRYAIFLILGCLRGFSLIPITYLILLGLVFLPALPAYILTIIGAMVSSASIYYFAEYLGLADYFERRYPRQIVQLKSVMRKNELPIVIGWSFFPLTPTDLMCYACGSLKIDVRKLLLGVFIGEGISCAIYIFAGKEFILLIMHRFFGA